MDEYNKNINPFDSDNENEKLPRQNNNGYTEPLSSDADEPTRFSALDINTAESDSTHGMYGGYTQFETSSHQNDFDTHMAEGNSNDSTIEIKLPENNSDTIDEIPALVRKAPYTESVTGKKHKAKSGKRFIAAVVAVTVLNLAVLGGMFALGYNSGENKSGITAKQQLIEALNNEGSGLSDPQSGASYTANSGAELETSEIAKIVGPAVVGITSTMQGQMSIFGGSQTSEAQGSGIITSADGYIVTNNHVVSGATAVKVLLNTGTEYDAKIIGTDEQTDLAIIKIEPTEELTVAVMGDSSSVQVGERAIAIGNPMGLEFFGSVTQGIVSAVNRTIQVDDRTMTLIQTDAAINSGNSGGALVNSRGEVIGINTVKVTSTGVEGMGFAIPISEAKPVLSDLLEYGYVKGRPVIGISTRDVTGYLAQSYNWPQGAQVMDVTSESARSAGLQQGDIITKVDGQTITSGQELVSIKDQHSPGDVLTLEVYKYATGATTTVQITLQEQLPG